MAQSAPEIPTTEALHQQYALNDDAIVRIEENRHAVSDVLTGRRKGLVAIIGPCAMTCATEIIQAEGRLLHAFTRKNQRLVGVHRISTWKPRSNPKDWHGLETEVDTVELAFRTIADEAEKNANVAIEIGRDYHVGRYGKYILYGWNGGRNVGEDDLVDAVATGIPTLPMGVKNGLDGNINPALEHVVRARKLRGEHGAAVTLIYRGGDNARTPEEWERNYRDALERTDGLLVVDAAHGGEMAFDPSGQYAKSVDGQIACMERIIELANGGEAPAGIMLEASDALSPTDPVMPYAVALDGVRRLCEMRAYLI